MLMQCFAMHDSLFKVIPPLLLHMASQPGSTKSFGTIAAPQGEKEYERAIATSTDPRGDCEFHWSDGVGASSCESQWRKMHSRDLNDCLDMQPFLDAIANMNEECLIVLAAAIKKRKQILVEEKKEKQKNQTSPRKGRLSGRQRQRLKKRMAKQQTADEDEIAKVSELSS